MKRILLILTIFILACDKEEEGITMKPGDLAGTYWKQTQQVSYEYHDGKLTNTRKNKFNGSVRGGPGPTVIYFQNGAALVEYHTMSPTGHLPNRFYKTRSYIFSPVEMTFRIYLSDGSPDDEWTLETFTPGRIVRISSGEYMQGSEKYVVRRRETFRRYKPGQEWLRWAAQYPNFDEIDFSNK